MFYAKTVRHLVAGLLALHKIQCYVAFSYISSCKLFTINVFVVMGKKNHIHNLGIISFVVTIKPWSNDPTFHPTFRLTFF